MINIIKVELFRLKKSKLFWIMLGLSAISPLISIALAMLLSSFFAGIFDGFSVSLGAIGMTSSLLSGLTQVYNDVALWSLITAAVVLSKEFSDGTMRNVVLANKSRAALYFSYLIIAMIVGLAYLTAAFAVVLVIAAPIFSFDGMSAAQGVSAFVCSYALGALAIAFVETCVCMFLFGVRKTWATILFPIIVCIFAPSMLNSFVSVATGILYAQGSAITADYTRWIPFVNMTNYSPANIDGTLIGMNIAYLAVFVTAFVLIGYYSFKKADLK